eukprot:6192394-Pleurochrysis_carterae.AAC.1
MSLRRRPARGEGAHVAVDVPMLVGVHEDVPDMDVRVREGEGVQLVVHEDGASRQSAYGCLRACVSMYVRVHVCARANACASERVHESLIGREG